MGVYWGSVSDGSLRTNPRFTAIRVALERANFINCLEEGEPATAVGSLALSRFTELLHDLASVMALGDNLDVTAIVDEIPLTLDAQGVYRVGGTRVTLDLVVRAFNRGATAEEIVQRYCSLRLPDVYQIIGYYLKHTDELTSYFEKRAREEQALLSSHPEWSPKGLRDRLLTRRNAQ